MQSYGGENDDFNKIIYLVIGRSLPGSTLILERGNPGLQS
jgi:hypothetical protein